MDVLGNKIKDLAIELTKIRSVVGTTGENKIADFIYKHLQKLDYYKDNPFNLRLIPLRNNALDKKYVMAIINSKNALAKKTALCLGHIDTVGIEDYVEIKEFATNPELLKEKLKEIKFSEPTASEIESNKWIFGRGILDMKTGVAALLVMVEKFSQIVDKLEGNLVFIFVPDEEGDSAGMHSAVQDLDELATQRNWEFIAAINTDYTTSKYPGDEHKYVYVGTVGKLLPCFYIYGEETHVGEAFNGVDANLLAAEVIREIDLCTDLCDIADGEVTLPPISLHQRDLKTEYSVQTANAVTLYFNYATHESQPDAVLEKCKVKASQSFQNMIDKLNKEYEKFCSLSNIPHKKLPWEVQVLSYEELYKNVKREMGPAIDERIEKLTRELLSKNVDDRDFSLAIVREVHKYYSDQNAKIIVYFSPPYYPHIYVKGENEKEINLLNAVNNAISDVKQGYNYNIVTKKFYPYISDLSCCSISRDENTIKKFTNNMPAWEIKYNLPIKSIQNISMPVVNIGPYGKDAHKLSERLCVDYSLDAMPRILEKTIENLLCNTK